ncbi:MAG: class I SAM-dependent methyltransferase [Acidimicrobiia bacterium]
MPRSKYLDPKRMIHGVRWRMARRKAARAPKPARLEPTGDQFRRAVFEHYGVDNLDDLDPTHRMWADFTLSSVDRGTAAVAMMGGEAAVGGKRVLDVGCAQGGFVVAASRAGASHVVGIDVNPKVFETAPLLLADYQVEADLRRVDLTQSGLPKDLGTFDLILCNDVLEHVTDVEKAISNLEQMMAPDARLFLEVPNGNAIHYVRSDGHYKLPGITLLDFEDARRWHRAFYPEAGPYDTFFYGSLEFYLAAFSRQGIALRLLQVPTDDDLSALRAEYDSLAHDFAGFREHHSEKPPELVDKIVTRAIAYQAQLLAQMERIEMLDNPRERTLLATSLRCTYEIGNWVLIGHRTL